ncbi:N-acetylneuraminate synthase family protein [Nitrosopumilus sp.]|nr:N-acetylneuraminate synthase family protein [Nitrosopumilus sp.]
MVFIIGEIGTNHAGDMNIAKKIIDAAVTAGFDAVKFQKKNVEKIYTNKFLDSYLESPWGTTQREMRVYREFSNKQFNEIDKYCNKKKIPWFVSCWDINSQIEMKKFKTKYNKIASAMLIHEKLLKIVAKEKKHTFISTGMSEMKDIEKAVKIFRKEKCSFELLHTNSSYPMVDNEANLKLISVLAKKFKCNVGYSGHEKGASIVSTAATIMGATTIERHITIDRTLYGHDQAASLELEGMRRLVRDVRMIDEIMGDGVKRIWKSELPNMKKLRQIFT